MNEQMEAGEIMLVEHGMLQLGIDIATVAIGIIAVFVVYKINRTLGGRINQALRLFVLGVLCNVSAVAWTLMYGHNLLIGTVNIDMHQSFMSIGMVFFIFSTTRFAKLIQ